MKFKNQKRRLFNKKAGASVGVAIKVLTSVVLGAAMLAGTYGIVKTNVVPTAENKVSSMFEATDTIGLSGGGSGGVVVPDPVVEIKRNGVIPEGGTYYVDATVEDASDVGDYSNSSQILTAGQNFPDVPTDGDTYVEGDYEYRYKYNYAEHGVWVSASPQSGWGVKVKDDTKTTYGQIISEIAGKPITNMSCTFYGCASLTTAPTIPSSITSMYETFAYCTSLTTASTIPNSVTNVYQTFINCASLTVAPIILSSVVTDMEYTFSGCTSLITAPTIPSGITRLSNTFEGCTSLTTAPVIPSSVTDMDNTFNGCTSLKTYVSSTDPDGDFSGYSIPNSVTNIGWTFSGCTSLTTAPTIPNSVTCMYATFFRCTSLTSAPSIPNSVTDMSFTFEDCTSLTGTIEVNANPTSYDDCLGNTQITGITGSCSQETKDALIATK